MGVKRMETRLITEYVRERLKNQNLQMEAIRSKAFINEYDTSRLDALQAAHEELSNLFDILGGYND